VYPIIKSGLDQNPSDLTLEPSGNSVLVSTVQGSIYRVMLDPDPQKSCNPGTLPLPKPLFSAGVNGRVDGITYDNSGKLFVVVNEKEVYQIDPTNGNVIKQTAAGVVTCVDPNGKQTDCGLDGMTFDPVTGDLWVSARLVNSLMEITTDLKSSNQFAKNMIRSPDGLESDGKGNIFVAAEDTNVYQYNIATNTATMKNAVPGLDDLAPLTGAGSPPGYVEICKQGDTTNPPPNQLYQFTVTAAGFTSGQLEVPLGDCSGSVQVPSGTVTITETPVIGVLVDNVTAYSYDQYGNYINELLTWTPPDLNANVGVMPGDVSLETVATFTNYEQQQFGQLKICKIAGQGVMVGTAFTFSVTAPGYAKMYTIGAGPAGQGGTASWLTRSRLTPS